MSLTHFQCVKEFNTQFGHASPDSVDSNVFDSNPKLVKLRYDLIAEEIKELRVGFETQDIIEMADALADILYVVHGAGVAFGINLDPYCASECVKPSKIKLSIFHDPHKSLFETLMSFMDRDLKSLYLAFEAKSIELTTEALCNLLHITYYIGSFLGLDLDVLFRIVHDNNMSKLCATEEIAAESVKHYATLPGFEKVNVSYRPSADSKYYVVFNKDTGKVLKSKLWVEPDFAPYFNSKIFV